MDLYAQLRENKAAAKFNVTVMQCFIYTDVNGIKLPLTVRGEAGQSWSFLSVVTERSAPPCMQIQVFHLGPDSSSLLLFHLTSFMSYTHVSTVCVNSETIIHVYHDLQETPTKMSFGVTITRIFRTWFIRWHKLLYLRMIFTFVYFNKFRI